MKRCSGVLLLLLFSGTPSTARAQVTAAGVKLGANFSKAIVDSDTEASLDSRSGFVAGAFVRFGMHGFALQPEVVFSMKGGQQPAGSDQFALKLNYLEVPLLLRLAVPVGHVAPFLVAGPSFGVL